jgi:hypothetical protein
MPNIWKNKIHVPNHQPEYLEMSSLSASHKRTPSKFRDSHYPLWVVPMLMCKHIKQYQQDHLFFKTHGVVLKK